MPVCPYENHRLRLDQHGRCERCSGDVRLYATLQQLSVVLYNEARRQWDTSQLEAASGLAEAALQLHESFAEPHWLLAAIDLHRGAEESARARLARARSLGARIEPDPGKAVEALPTTPAAGEDEAIAPSTAADPPTTANPPRAR